MPHDAALAMRPFTRSLPMALLQAREASMRLFRPMLNGHGLTEQQWRVLRALASPAAPMDAGKLADTTFLLAPSLSRILSNLEERELIERTTPEEDQRRSIIELTAAGQDLVNEVAPHSEALYQGLEERFGGERLEALLSELRALTELAAETNSRDGRHRLDHDRW